MRQHSFARTFFLLRPPLTIRAWRRRWGWPEPGSGSQYLHFNKPKSFFFRNARSNKKRLRWEPILMPIKTRWLVNTIVTIFLIWNFNLKRAKIESWIYWTGQSFQPLRKDSCLISEIWYGLFWCITHRSGGEGMFYLIYHLSFSFIWFTYTYDFKYE